MSEAIPGSDWLETMKRLRRFKSPKEGPFVSPQHEEPDGFVAVGWDQNGTMPAYRVHGSDGTVTLVPFTPLAQTPPADGVGRDWYVEEFSDAAIKKRWQSAISNPETRRRIHAERDNFAVPHQFRATGSVDRRGAPGADGTIRLEDIRRPSFFAEAPWHEPIAQADAQTSIVEVMVPREPYERMHMGLESPIAIRGWHIAGGGIDDGKGAKVRALIVFTAGRSIETTAIRHPDDENAHWDEDAGGWLQTDHPGSTGRTECWGAGSWRTNYLLRFWKAGFDVLTFDKRGHGISEGANDSNTNEQANDIFRALEALETGAGLRVLTPAGDLLEGGRAAGNLLAGYAGAKDLPVFLSGPSQGCMVTSWAMHKNFVGGCDFERPNPQSHGPLGYNIRGALILAPFPAGLGYRAPDDSLVEASRRLELNVQMFATSEILGNIHRWPSLFVGRGLWDFSESLEGTYEAYLRAAQPKQMIAVRGPHGENEWGQPNIDHMVDAMVAFASKVLIAPDTAFPELASLRAVVESAPDHWPEEAWPLS